MFKKITIGSIAALCLCGGVTAYAEVEPGAYAGGSIGQAQTAIDAYTFDESDMGFKVFAGYTFNSHAAIELSYVDGGAPTLATATGSIETSATAVIASVIVGMPFAKRYSGYAKGGFAFYDTDTTVQSRTTSSSATDTNVGLAFGLGASATLWPWLEVRAEYDMVMLDDSGFSMLSLGALYRF